MKKLFGGINLTWTKLIIMSVIMGIYTAVVAMIPTLHDTSFCDLTISFEVWILFGILIIMNSSSAKDSALKCFVFFLISQPLVYLIQDVINHSSLFMTYYKYWFIWTIACIPMGFIGYYMKKNKWWGLLILTPILLLLGKHYGDYLSQTMFSFPRHLLTTVFCFVTLIIYPVAIFKDKKIKISGVIISVIIIIVMSVLNIMKPPVYSTEIMGNNEEHSFDGTYKVYLKDNSYGDLKIEKIAGEWMIHAEFKKAGKTEFTLESSDGNKRVYDLTIKRDTYEYKEKNNN